MKVRRTITIDSKLDERILKLIDEELKKEMKNRKNLNLRELNELKKKYNYSRMVENLIRKAIGIKEWGF